VGGGGGSSSGRSKSAGADAAALPFADGAFGAVVNLAALDLYPDAARVVAEAGRVLAPGGSWAASTFVSPELVARSTPRPAPRS